MTIAIYISFCNCCNVISVRDLFNNMVSPVPVMFTSGLIFSHLVRIGFFIDLGNFWHGLFSIKFVEFKKINKATAVLGT